jgi:hypothetical protein
MIEPQKNMTTSRPDFSKALDAVVGARTREATRQISRRNEYLLLGAFTKRPN